MDDAIWENEAAVLICSDSDLDDPERTVRTEMGLAVGIVSLHENQASSMLVRLRLL